MMKEETEIERLKRELRNLSMERQRLRADIRAAEKRVQQIYEDGIVSGRAQLRRTHFSGPRQNEWQVRIMVKALPPFGDGKERWYAFQKGQERQDVVNGIDEIVKDLLALKEKIKEAVD